MRTRRAIGIVAECKVMGTTLPAPAGIRSNVAPTDGADAAKC
jgi:hypothetical protein